MTNPGKSASPTLHQERAESQTVHLRKVEGQALEHERTPYFTLYLLRKGKGEVRAGDAHYTFRAPVLLAFNPYQLVAFSRTKDLSGTALQFHANFFCIEAQHEAVGCNGVLFNDIYGAPVVELDDATAKEFATVLGGIRRELLRENLAHQEIIVSYLKILLITATRLKLEQQKKDYAGQAKLPEALQRLRQIVEENFSREHRPQFYAEQLGYSPKALGRLVKTHFHQTLTELIRERVLKHAKWQILHTRRQIKDIAFESGFDDELYFSRLFKKACGCSPAHYREYETQLREGRNLSMRSAPPSIPSKARVR
jgi:AraC-like DNA-binding protein